MYSLFGLYFMTSVLVILFGVEYRKCLRAPMVDEFQLLDKEGGVQH